jgi:hypothetical protein
MQLTIIHIHRFEFPPWLCHGGVTRSELRDLETHLMSALSDKVAEIKAAVEDMKARVMVDIDALRAKIEAGVATPEVLADLDSIKESLKFDPIPDEPTA